MTPGEFDLPAESEPTGGGWQENAGEPSLGSDPFDEVVEFDPFESIASSVACTAPAATAGKSAGGAEAEPRWVRVRPNAGAGAGAGARSEAREGELAPRGEQAPGDGPHGSSVPTLAEVECLPPASFVERLLGTEERRRLAALEALVDREAPYDRFGMSPAVLRRAFPLFYVLHRAYFAVRSEGHEHLPARGPVVLASNHGGLLPFDGAMLVVDVLLNTDPPRLLRSIVDRWVGSLPWLNVFYARVGQIIGERENFENLLEDGQAVLVFPEGTAGIRKTIRQRNQVQRFHVGFVEAALRARAPIVPTAVVGPDDQAPILFDFQGLARRLGLPALPITPTFPWLGPLGLLPYPVRYRIVYGEPMNLFEQYSPKAANEPRLVEYLSRLVRERVQKLVDRAT